MVGNRRVVWLLVVVCVAASTLLWLVPGRAGATPLPNRFQDTAVLSGLNAPTVVRFSPDGRIFVAEKSGILLEYASLSDTSPTVVVDLSSQVYNYQDSGLLGMTLDPNFPAAPYVYLLYTYDGTPPGLSPGQWNDACPAPPSGGGTADGCPVTSKLVRIALSGNTIAGAPMTLISGEWCQQYGSHTIGDLNFGADGKLYVSAGDGAGYQGADYGQNGGSPSSPVPVNPCGDPPAGVGGAETSPTAEGGALRSQSARRPSNEAAALNGSVLRVDPGTGQGASDNPLAVASDANRRRVVAYGLRNPFRFTFRPGTNDLWIADVGWGTWDEIDRVPTPTSAAPDFGWPCYEGGDQVSAYSGFDVCTSLYSSGSATAPYFAYKQGLPVVNGETCPTGGSSVSGVAFHETGTYPVSYDGALFFADHTRNCIWAMLPGSNGLPDPSSVVTFEQSAAHPVDLVSGPGGDLFYVDYEDGEIHRISYAAPAVTLTSPADGAQTHQATPTYSGAAGTAAGDLSTITVRIYRGSTATGSPVQTLITTASGGTWSATPITPLTPDGLYTAQAEQDDSAGSHALTQPVTIDVEATPPRNTSPPVVTGTPVAGQAIHCSTGLWTGAQTFAIRWTRAGTAIAGASGERYVIRDADVAAGIACDVTAGNLAGQASTSSRPVLALSRFGQVRVGAPHVHGTRVTVALTCRGVAPQSCPVTLTLSRTRHGHTSSLGTKALTILTGRRADATVGLNRPGRRLLARGRRLAIQLMASEKGVRKPVVLRSWSVTFRSGR